MRKRDIVGLVIVFIIAGLIITAFVFSGLECLQVKDVYENNPEFAREKYGYDSFEEWRLNGATRDYGPSCFPNVDLGIIPG